jgi:hypothetical protein
VLHRCPDQRQRWERPEWDPVPVLISDHINLTAVSPVEGLAFVDHHEEMLAAGRAAADSYLAARSSEIED